MILTWLGIVVMVAVLVAWVIYENRRLIAARRAIPRGETDPPGGPAASARRSGRQPMIKTEQKRQIEFLPLQTHVKGFEYGDACASRFSV